jgi:hypothetical protein
MAEEENNDLIFEGEDFEGDDIDAFDQINEQNDEAMKVEVGKPRNEVDKRQKFDSAEHEIKKQKAKMSFCTLLGSKGYAQGNDQAHRGTHEANPLPAPRCRQAGSQECGSREEPLVH